MAQNSIWISKGPELRELAGRVSRNKRITDLNVGEVYNFLQTTTLKLQRISIPKVNKVEGPPSSLGDIEEASRGEMKKTRVKQ